MPLFSSRLLPARQALPLGKQSLKISCRVLYRVRFCRQPSLRCHLPGPQECVPGTPVYLALKGPSSSHDVTCGAAASVGPQMLSTDALGTEPAIAAKVSSPGVDSPGETKAAPGRDGHQALRKGILLPKLLICD